MFDEQSSFVFFFYDQISLGGFRIVNIGFGPSSFRNPSAIPFDFPGVLTGSALSSVAEGSNTGSPGFYAYQVDMRVIIQPNG